MMRYYSLLRLLITCLLLYAAWPLIPLAITQIEMVFWGIWIVFFLLVIGSNLSTLLQMTDPPVMEQDIELERQTHNH